MAEMARDRWIKTQIFCHPALVHEGDFRGPQGQKARFKVETIDGDNFYFAKRNATYQFLDRQGFYMVHSAEQMQALWKEIAQPSSLSPNVPLNEIWSQIEPAGGSTADEEGAQRRGSGFKKKAGIIIAAGGVALGSGLASVSRSASKLAEIDPVRYLETGEAAHRREALTTISVGRKKELLRQSFQVQGDTIVYTDNFHFLKNNEASLPILARFISTDLVPGARIVGSKPAPSTAVSGQVQAIEFTIQRK